MKKSTNTQKFEFLFKINNNIICQRVFNVSGYNPDVLKSLEMKQLVDNITGMNNGKFGSCGIIPQFFKDKTNEYLWNRYNPYSENVKQVEGSSKDALAKKEDIFSFEIKVDNHIVANSMFSGSKFPWFELFKSKHIASDKDIVSINIKPIIPSIIEEINNYFTLKNYTLVA